MQKAILFLLSLSPLYLCAQLHYTTAGAQCGEHASGGCEHYQHPCSEEFTAEIQLVLSLEEQLSAISWRLYDGTENQLLAENGVLNNYTTYKHLFCAYTDRCYRFVIEDDGGEGLTPGGEYILYWNGREVGRGAAFGALDSLSFGACCTNFSAELKGGMLCRHAEEAQISLNTKGGTPPYNYSWSKGDVYAEKQYVKLSDEKISATVTDAAGCQTSDTLYLQELPELEIALETSPVIESKPEVGTAMVSAQGGLPPFSYLWSNGAATQRVDNLSEGDYKVTVTDAGGCSLTQTATVLEIPSPVLRLSTQTLVDCHGGHSGAATVAAMGGAPPYTYAWSNGGQGQTQTNLSAGDYTVTLTDRYGFMDTVLIVVDEPDVLQALVAQQTDVACPDGATGAVTVEISGGVPAYRYAWSNGSTDLSPNGLTAGVYSLTATDANDCKTSLSIEIKNMPDITAPVVKIQNLNVYLDENGEASLSPEAVDAGSFDNCGISALEVDKDYFSCNELGPNSVRLTARDANNNASFELAEVMALDTISPRLNCPADIVSDVCQVVYEPPQASDNCQAGTPFLLEGLASGEDFPLGTSIVSWRVDDLSANFATCSFKVTIENSPANPCVDPAAISIGGRIVTEQEEAVENVAVNLMEGTTSAISTTTNGIYAFENLKAEATYTIQPAKDEDYINGVSTFDLLLIAKHLLGSRKLDSPYKLIAADVDRSGNISALDLIHLRKLILSIYTDLPDNTSWRFVPASFQFPDETNPWQTSFPESLNYTDLQSDVADADFVGIKIGDVNGTAVVNRRMSRERKLSGVFYLQIKDQEMIAGNNYRLSFSAGELAEVQGYQFTLNYQGLELLDIEYGTAEAEHFGLIEEGVMTMSWNRRTDFQSVTRTTDFQPVASTAPFFILSVRAQKSARLSDLLKINSHYTQAEAYDLSGELLNVALDFSEEGKSNSQTSLSLDRRIRLYPNPTAGKWYLDARLDRSQKLRITLFDQSGRQIQSTNWYYDRSGASFEFDIGVLPSGLYRIKIGSENGEVVWKEVILQK